IPVGEHFSFHAETGGDINGDGRPDLVFSCIDELNYSNCPVYIYYSIPDSNAVPDQILTTPWPNVGGFGYSLAYAGDLNGDGISDLAVGVRYYGEGLSGGTQEIGNFSIYKQISEAFDFIPDYINTGGHAANNYGWGYNLGDMNGGFR
ncbi:MAG: integrin alpha, partial [Candidatus Cloacimonadaceae bacterium]|nr:integrin alpha [Candidatus Cloacimonadaceae bacterium]